MNMEVNMEVEMNMKVEVFHLCGKSAGWRQNRRKD